MRVFRDIRTGNVATLPKLPPVLEGPHDAHIVHHTDYRPGTLNAAGPRRMDPAPTFS